MASKNSNVRKLKTQPKPVLNSDELQRIAEKLAVALEHNTEEISLMTLLSQPISRPREITLMLTSVMGLSATSVSFVELKNPWWDSTIHENIRTIAQVCDILFAIDAAQNSR